MAAEEVTDQSGHVDYPHEAGYLVDCPGCESGPCVCSVPCSDAECVEGGKHAPGARFQHYAPCNSEDCEHPESTEPDREEIEREYAYTSGALASEDAARVEFTYYAQRISASASTDEDMGMSFVQIAQGPEFGPVRTALAEYMRSEADTLEHYSIPDYDQAARDIQATAREFDTMTEETAGFTGDGYSAVHKTAAFGIRWSLIRSARKAGPAIAAPVTVTAQETGEQHMSMEVPFETVITSIERGANSRNGNPTWVITTPLGTWSTAADISDAYKLSSSDEGKRVRINAFSGRKYMHISNIDVWTRFPDGREDWY